MHDPEGENSPPGSYFLCKTTDIHEWRVGR